MIMRPEPKGWCPGAHRPMQSGDGMIVRVRPRLSQISAAQAKGLARLARQYGNGQIDLTNRANLQLRGLLPDAVAPVVQDLSALGLLDLDAATESRRNILTQPLWQSGDDSHHLTQELAARLNELPELPAKFGFAIDCGPAPFLSSDPADIRLERSADGGVIVRADGLALGAPVALTDAVGLASAVAHWVAQTAQTCAEPAARRMAHLMPNRAALLPDWAQPRVRPAAPAVRLCPGPHPLGYCAGAGFGQISADALDTLADRAPGGLRLTPWRLLIALGGGGDLGQFPAALGLITRADDPLLAVDACVGAPFCGAATVATRPLAGQLAAGVLAPALASGQTLHVSGCSKGCARARVADLTLVGAGGRFDIVRGGVAWDTAEETGLAPDEISGVL